VNFLESLGKNPQMRIALPEAIDGEILRAARRALDEKICHPVLIGDPDKIRAAADAAKVDLKNLEIIQPDGDALDFGLELLKNKKIDGLVAGRQLTSRAVLLKARDILGIEPGVKTFSSLFVMDFPARAPLILADCGVVNHPGAERLADIATGATDFAAKIFDEVNAAFLSFSTLGSGGHDPTIDIILQALELVKNRRPSLNIDGEMQLDAAINPSIAARKAPRSPVAGRANLLIVPDLNAGNIFYKSLEQFAGARAYGPILLGFSRPLSDLSRGSTVDDIFGTLAVLAASLPDKN
jgi:phosphate acetyltransferase